MGQWELLDWFKNKRAVSKEFYSVREVSQDFDVTLSSLHKSTRRLWYSGFLETSVRAYSERLKRGYSIKYRYKKR